MGEWLSVHTWKSPTAAPDPDEEPPGVLDGSCGFFDLGPTVVLANSVVVVLPNISAPAARRVMMGAASMRPGALFSCIGEL